MWGFSEPYQDLGIPGFLRHMEWPRGQRQLFQPLGKTTPGTDMRPSPVVFLDDATPGAERLLGFHEARHVISAATRGEVPAALAALESARARGRHLAGYFSYELGHALEPRLGRLGARRADLPFLWFAEFDRVERFEGADVARQLSSRVGGRAYAGALLHEWNEDDYGHRFRLVQNLIRAGDIYQTNLTFRSRFAFVGDPLALYLSLRERSLASCGAYIDDGRRQILSLSPERFFEITKDGRITARPMKGTARRGRDVMSDERAREALASSDKDRAENLMIVDLIRNDLGRIAEIGSVEVRELFAVERYPTLHQLVSTVTAQLKRDVGIEQIVKALFPCGSVTGAPKIRAMEVIDALEASPRGLYCGAIGHFAPDGSARFNVAIRTLTIEGEAGELGIGGGVVQDSIAAAEYRECLLKAEYFGRARRQLGLIETLQLMPVAGLVRGDLHLARLERSARCFGIPFDASAARRSLEDRIAACISRSRVRLKLEENGSLSVSLETIGDEPQPAWRFAISSSRVSSVDAIARHKTDWRSLYDRERVRMHQANGCDEVVFLNERDELVEGSRTNLFLKRGERLLTPPLSSGCLDGCLRRELLEQGMAAEATLREHDLATGTLFLGNSLRGLTRARPVDAAGVDQLGLARSEGAHECERFGDNPAARNKHLSS